MKKKERASLNRMIDVDGYNKFFSGRLRELADEIESGEQPCPQLLIVHGPLINGDHTTHFLRPETGSFDLLRAIGGVEFVRQKLVQEIEF